MCRIFVWSYGVVMGHKSSQWLHCPAFTTCEKICDHLLMFSNNQICRVPTATTSSSYIYIQNLGSCTQKENDFYQKEKVQFPKIYEEAYYKADASKFCLLCCQSFHQHIYLNYDYRAASNKVRV